MNDLISAKFPFASKFLSVNGSSIHYIEVGKGSPILFLHGNPTSSYLWRNIIPIASKVGRCIALDLVGFGKSSKPDIDYGFQDHYEYVRGFIEAKRLENIIITGHDWGGVLGFWYAYNYRQNVRGIAFMETFPFTFTIDIFPPEMQKLFKSFRTSGQGYQLIQVQNMFVEQVLPSGVFNKENLTDEIMRSYRNPFPTIESRKPIRRFPEMLPMDPNIEKETYSVIKSIEQALTSFKIPMLLIKGEPGAVISERRSSWLKERIPHLVVKDIGPCFHYLQEDNPKDIGMHLADWVKSL